MRLREVFTPALRLAVLALCAALSACSQPGVSFSTTLGQPDGLAAHDPVTHAGSKIGDVTSVRSSVYGSPTVNFYVEQDDWGLVHQDSIVVLQNTAGAPALNIENPSPMSPVAAAGAQLTGASSQAEADTIRMSRGLGSYAMGLTQFLGSVNSGPNPPANSAAVAAAMAQLFALQQMTAANVYANSPQVRQQVYQLNQQLQAIANQMQAAGNSLQAQQLRNQIARMLAASVPPPPPPPSASGTLETPKVYP